MIPSINNIAIARNTARNIRKAFQNHKLTAAYRIGDAAKASEHLPHSPPSRLPIHTLVHGLLRLEMPHIYDAARYIEWMTEAGIRVRPTTLRAAFNTSIDSAPEHTMARWRVSGLARPSIVTLKESTVAIRAANNAAKLLLLARQHMYPRTSAMYKDLITVLIRSKEFIGAALIFEMMVKDYQLLQTLPELIKNAHGNPEFRRHLERRYSHLRSENIFPDSEILDSICLALQHEFSQNEGQPSIAVHIGLQSLAILGALLDRHQLPFGNIERLLETLATCPQVSGVQHDIQIGMVWVGVNPMPVQVNAHAYTQALLQSLVHNLPVVGSTAEVNISGIVSAPDLFDLLPPLDLPSCNVLLRLALRHWNDPKLAGKVLTHIMQDGRLKMDSTISKMLAESPYQLEEMMLGGLSASTNSADLESTKGTALLPEHTVVKT